MAKQMVATETFRAVVNGFSELVKAGETIVDADHELVRDYPDKFERATVSRPDVEAATQAPGERRGDPK